ncbi:uncharacterized protein Aud_004061 [Aspergillus udagawae]|uniref:Uncharacterized protein n=1 Tax=Aspergillus udagawae TaxID=91492 RepID=A0A8E0UVS4_9EURO|nr:uncharacterized protein Aud_004061 [Aspergillus udagawae]GIC87672.1 hypothetical protein Aud_004061 [Aspergillus udagawae]
MEEQSQHSTPFTEFIYHPARGFQTWQELCTHIRREVLQAQSSTEIDYISVSPDWGPVIVDSLDEDGDVERLNAAPWAIQSPVLGFEEDTQLLAHPYVNVVVIIMYARKGNTSQVEGKAELYVRDADGNPALQYEATIFPATQSECSLGISAGDLFGPVLPQGLQANTVLPLSIDNLRSQAHDAMVHMDMVPAT